DASLDRVPDHARRIAVVETVDRDDPGWRGDVVLGPPFAADHVDADEDEAAYLERRAEDVANLLLARGEFGGLGIAADREVRTEFAFAGLAVDRARDLAVDEDDALVALADARQELLDHEGFGPDLPEQLDERAEIAAVGVDLE